MLYEPVMWPADVSTIIYQCGLFSLYSTVVLLVEVITAEVAAAMVVTRILLDLVISDVGGAVGDLMVFLVVCGIMVE